VRAYNAIVMLFYRASPKTRKEFTKRLFVESDVDDRNITQEHSMTWGQIAELSSDPLVTIGAHTITHPCLATLDDKQTRTEIENSKNTIEKRIGKPVEHFAYPFGGSADCGVREFEMAARAGFKTAVTARIANLFPEHIKHTLCLPRISLHDRSDKFLDLEHCLNGYFPAQRYRFKKVITSQ